MARTCVVRLLGGFSVEVAGRRVPADAWRHRRGADLVKVLALAPQHRLHREQVTERLWPDLAADAGAANLRKAIHYARRALGQRDSVEAAGDIIVLWPAGELRVDAQEIDEEAARALAAGTGLDAVVERLAGDLLPEDRYAEWTQNDRERFRARRMQVLRAAGRWGQILDLDPSDEEACRALMQMYLASGNRQSAIRQFQRLREILRADLGVAPEPATVALFEQALSATGTPQPSAAERAQALLARGLLQWNEGALDDAGRSAEQARAIALSEQLGRELGESSSLLGMVAMARGRWPDVFRLEFRTAVQLRPDEAPFVLDANLCLAEAWLAGVDCRGTGKLAHELLQLARASKSAPGEALLSLLIGQSEFLSGHLEESDEWLSRAEDMYNQMSRGSGTAWVLTHIAAVATARHHPAEASRRLTKARALAEQSVLSPHLHVRIVEGLIKSAEGADRRQKMLEEAQALIARPRELCGPCSIGMRVAAAIGCAQAGDLVRSRRWLEGAERLAGMWSGGPWQAAVWEARAALRQAEGDRGRALALLREASNLFTESGRPLDAARCQAAITASEASLDWK